MTNINYVNNYMFTKPGNNQQDTDPKCRDRRKEVLKGYVSVAREDKGTLNDYFEQKSIPQYTSSIKYRADCQGLDLGDMQDYDFNHCDFSKAIFQEVKFNYIDFSGISLYRTRIDDADFSHSKNLTLVQLIDAKFTYTGGQHSLKAIDRGNKEVIRQAYKLKPMNECYYLFKKHIHEISNCINDGIPASKELKEKIDKIIPLVPQEELKSWLSNENSL